MKLSDFQYDLPPQLVAQHPLAKRDNARLLVLDKGTGKIEHDVFKNIGRYLPPRSLIVRNDSKVIPARLIGRKERSGGHVELFLLNQLKDKSSYEVLMRPMRRLKEGDNVLFDHGSIQARIIDKENRIVRFNTTNVESYLSRIGRIPLPPYIKREDTAADRHGYQTVYARHKGSVASPTAGLHFTKILLNRLKAQKHAIRSVTLHINYGTFKPVECEDITEHKMHEESYVIPATTLHALKKTKTNKQPIVGVGTTVTRVLETWAINKASKGRTALFIYPGYTFKMVDALITNFHLPATTLFMLVCAFGGLNNVQEAYHQAIKEKYRFYSYGDAMLIK